MAEIPQFEVGNWSMLLTIAEKFDIGDALKRTYLFRGQENVGWSLKPTLQRAATNDDRTPLPPAEELLRIEGFLTDQFRGAAPNHLPSATLAATHALIDWWPLMRHHGVPTRLLDWTASLYVATYFAVSKCPDKDGAVYVVHVQTLQDAMKAAFGDAATLPTTLPDADREFQRADALPVIDVFSRKNALLDRMIVQQGVFMTSRNPAADVEQVLATEVPKVASPGKEVLRKLRIPAAQKPAMMRRLRTMNVTASSLFPGLDGVGRQLDELIRNR
jgi:hypothetical protein